MKPYSKNVFSHGKKHHTCRTKILMVGINIVSNSSPFKLVFFHPNDIGFTTYTKTFTQNFMLIHANN